MKKEESLESEFLRGLLCFNVTNESRERRFHVAIFTFMSMEFG